VVSAGRKLVASPSLFLPRGWRGNILTFSLKRGRIEDSVSTETNILIQRAAAAELKTAGAREIYVFGSAAKGTGDAASDLDLAVSGLPPSVFYRMGARVSDLIGHSVDLIDLDINTPFTRYLRTENELVRVG
jgi:predicted nucleotidyltransferase